MAFPTGWGRKCVITIPAAQISGSNANFPVFVTEANLPAEMLDGGANSALNGGGDVRFSEDSAGATQVPIEVVSFITGGTPSAEIHVKLPSVNTGADKTYYVWYKKAAEVQPLVTDTYGRNAVWSDYGYVLHLGAVAPGSIVDSTGNHIISVFGSPVNDAGMLKFDGVNDYLSLPDSTQTRQTTLSTLTAVARIRVDYAGDHHYFHSKRGSGAVGQAYRIAGNSPTYTKYGIADYGFGAVTVDTVDKDFYAFTVNGTSAKDFQNGVLKNTITVSSTVGTNTNPVIVGAGQSTSGAASTPYTLGWTGELRFSNTVERPTSWLTTKYNNQSNPAAFGIAGTPQAVGGGGVTGTGALTLGSLTLSASGFRTLKTTGAISLTSFTMSGTGERSIIGSGNVNLPSIVMASSAVLTRNANGTISLPAIALSGVGSKATSGTGTIPLPAILVSGQDAVARTEQVLQDLWSGYLADRGHSGTFNDRLASAYLAQTGASSGHLNDLMKLYFTQQGFISGTIDDQLAAFLKANFSSFSGTTQDVLRQALKTNRFFT